MHTKTPIVIVAAMSHTAKAIGNNNELLWHVPADMRRFKSLTLGHPIIMGRKTFESILAILGKPLPNRTNIVVTRDLSYTTDGAKIAHSLEEAIAVAESENPTEIHIGGGAELYRQALPFVTRLYITWFFDDKPADTFFPAFESDFEVTHEHPKEEYKTLNYQWVDYVRKSS